MIGLLITKGNYAIDSLLALNDLPVGFINTTESLGFDSNLFYKFLPLVSAGEVAVITSSYIHSFIGENIDLSEFLYNLRKNFKKLILLDQADPFLLDFSEEKIKLFDKFYKVNGKYKDFDLYNYNVGSPSPDGIWTEKLNRGNNTYSAAVNSLINLSIPCFLGCVPSLRVKVRRFYEKSPVKRKAKDFIDILGGLLSARRVVSPTKTVHFIGSLTNIQRKTAVEKLKDSSLPWKGGITSIPYFIAGLQGFGMAKLSEDEKSNLTKTLTPILTKPLNRFDYYMSMFDCKAVLSIAGYGELCFRMAEAYQFGRLLICQNISHVETLFPFENGKNVVFCNPDLSNLMEILDDVECNYQNKYRIIAERGEEDWKKWSQNFELVVRNGFKSLYD